MEIYHGSEKIIKNPQFGFGNKNNDYGLAFYCTKNKELAKEWACQNNFDGYVNIYNLNENNLSILDLSKTEYNILHWLTILLQNRIFTLKSPVAKSGLDFLLNNYSIKYNDYDIIYGYRADDSYFSFATDFLENIIPVQALANSMKLGSLGFQVAIKSQKAFLELEFIDCEKSEKNKYYEKYKIRDSEARNNYFNEQKNVTLNEAIFLLDIIRNPGVLNDLQL